VWLESSADRTAGKAPLFARWPLLAPPLVAWAKEEVH